MSTLVLFFLPTMPSFTPTELHASTRGKCPNYCWLLCSSIRTVGGAAACSKAPRKLELRKGESLLIHVCCAHIFPAGPETKLGNSLTQSLLAHFLATAAPSLSPLSVCACFVCLHKVSPFPSFQFFLLSSCLGGSTGG